MFSTTTASTKSEKASMSSSSLPLLEVEDTLRRIASHKGVQGIIICNNAGFVLKSTLSPEDTSSYSENVQQCILFANHLVQAQNSEEKVEFLRIRTSKNEIMIVPDKEFILLVVQDTSLATLTENSFHHLLNKK